MRTAREAPGEYGARYSRVPMAFEVMGEEETEDHYVVTLTFRPQGEFEGTPGQEQFFIEKEGSVAHGQVMSIPRSPGGRRTKTVLVAIGSVIIAAGAAGGFVLASGGGGGDDGTAAPIVQPSPTNAPVPAKAAQTVEPTPTPIAASATASPVAPTPAQELPTSTAFPAIAATFTPTPTPTAVPMRPPTFTPTSLLTPSPSLPSVTSVAEVASQWMPSGDMAGPRRDHAAVLLDDGTVLVVGGTRSTAELYDPATRAFTSLGSVPFSQGVAAVKLADGRVLVVGQSQGLTVMIYDPATRRFA